MPLLPDLSLSPPLWYVGFSRKTPFLVSVNPILQLPFSSVYFVWIVCLFYSVCIISLF